VRFWNTSAIVPLCVTQPATAQIRGLIETDPSLMVWWATRTECLSTFARRRRDGHLGAPGERQGRHALAAIATEWSEGLPSEQLRLRAERLLNVHALRVADAFQLGGLAVVARRHDDACDRFTRRSTS